MEQKILLSDLLAGSEANSGILTVLPEQELHLCPKEAQYLHDTLNRF
jgi:hypothetical protein